MSVEIQKIDKNFSENININRESIVFMDTKKPPFDIYGAVSPFFRLPEEVARNTNNGVSELFKNTTGIRVRFCTDSPYIAVLAKIPVIQKCYRQALTGATGFDMYEYKEGKYKFLKVFEPEVDENGRVIGIYDFKTEGMHSLVINFPLYNNVDELYIGIKENSQIVHGDKYLIEKPIVYYGSSITQGGCASRPGTAYEAIISRMFDADFVNLGFSGNAFGEENMANYISNLEMSLFVLDYDHNAPNAEHLKNTHHRFFEIIRKKNPNLPILMLSMPFTDCVNDADERRKIIEATYNNAVNSGDRNVYFIDGSTVPAMLGGDNATIDACHPNDLGFMCFAEIIGTLIKNNIKCFN